VTRLLDANVLIALFDGDHLQHREVRDWFAGLKGGFATCPFVQGALVRWVIRIEGPSGPAAAVEELKRLGQDPRHQFWADGLPFIEVNWKGVIGHRQVTEAYLASLARSRNGRLATLDRGLAALHADVAELIGSPTVQESRG
jgi:uncharacterized protein